MSHYRMHRGWMDNAVFGDSPLSEREAWCWLIERAAWKDRQYRIGSKVIGLKRGQYCASLRYLADAWKWGKDKVRRYLILLESAEMIRLESATAARQSETLITVCNYDIYQAECDTSETENATDARHTRDSGETEARQPRDKTEEVIEVITTTAEVIASERDPVREALDCIGAWDDPNCRIHGGRVLDWIRQGADLDLDIIPTLKAVTERKRKRDGPRWMPRSMNFYDEAMATAVANRTRPLPKGKPNAQSPRSRHVYDPAEARRSTLAAFPDLVGGAVRDGS